MFPLVLLATVQPAPPSLPRLSDVLRDVLGDCRLPADGSVVVCGRRSRESPYRLPPEVRDPGFQIDGPIDSVSRERHKLMEGGESGTHSCSPSGAGGWTGCMLKGWQRADQQRGYQNPK